jgi:hypothetical protein
VNYSHRPGRNEQKNTPHNDPLQELREFLGYDPDNLLNDEWVDAEARQIVKSIKESCIGEDLKLFRREGDLKEAAKELDRAHKILKRIAPLLREDLGNQTIQVKEWKNGRLQEDTYIAAIKLVDYLASGHLKRIATSLERYKPAAVGRTSKYAIKIAGEELVEHYRRNGKKVDWTKIAEITLEEIPDPQGLNSAKKGEWMRQHVKRK